MARRVNRLCGWRGVLVVILGGMAAAAEAITDPEIQAKFAAMAAYQPAPGEAYSEEAFAAFLRDLVADVCLGGEGIDHLEALTPLFLYHPQTRERMLVRLDELREGSDVAGARAAAMALVLRVRDRSPEAMVAVVGETLAHPGMGACVRAGRASDLLTILRGLPVEALEPNAEAVAALGEHFDASMSHHALAISSDFTVLIGRLAGVLGEQRATDLRKRFEGLVAETSPAEAEKTDMQDVEGMVHP